MISESILFFRLRSFISDSWSRIRTFTIFSSLCKKSFSVSGFLFAAELGFLPFFLFSDPPVAKGTFVATSCESCIGRNGATFGFREELNGAWVDPWAAPVVGDDGTVGVIAEAAKVAKFDWAVAGKDAG